MGQLSLFPFRQELIPAELEALLATKARYSSSGLSPGGLNWGRK